MVLGAVCPGDVGDPGRRRAVDAASLRHVVFAGEVFPTPYLRRLAALVPTAALHNWYGPTETNVCTYHDVEADDIAEGRDDRSPSAGRARTTTASR